MANGIFVFLGVFAVCMFCFKSNTIEDSGQLSGVLRLLLRTSDDQ